MSDHTSIIQTQPMLASRFEIVRMLGQGSAGTVYLVRDLERDSKEVALKILINQDAFDEHTLERFRREFSVLQQIRHPNLIAAYDMIELPNTVAYTMEFVRGMDLGRICAQSRPKPGDIDRYFQQLLSALHELHRNDILHRDIKLENIIIQQDGTAKLSDLGLMKNPRSAKLTRTGILLGTAQYMPPEYIKESKFDYRGDIYAAGIMLYEIMSGKRRLLGLNGMAVIELLIKTKFDLPKITLHGAPPKYLRIIETATDLDPRRRYQTALEMADAFAGVKSIPGVPSGQTLKPSIKIFDYEGRTPSSKFACLKVLVPGLLAAAAALFFAR